MGSFQTHPSNVSAKAGCFCDPVYEQRFLSPSVSYVLYLQVLLQPHITHSRSLSNLVSFCSRSLGRLFVYSLWSLSFPYSYLLAIVSLFFSITLSHCRLMYFVCSLPTLATTVEISGGVSSHEVQARGVPRSEFRAGWRGQLDRNGAIVL